MFFVAHQRDTLYDQGCSLTAAEGIIKEQEFPHHRSFLLRAATEERELSSAPSNSMITLIVEGCNDLTQEIYDKILDFLPLYQIRCVCGQAGHLVRHAYYNRKVKRRKETVDLCVLRVKCQSCGRTHAILTDQIVPYEQVAVDLQQEMILFSLWSPEIQKMLEENQDITESDVATVKRRFKKHWKERLSAMGKEITDSISDLIRAAFSTFHRQFMQIRSGINMEFFSIHIA